MVVKKLVKNMPKYPIYVISKGRAESRLTITHLEKMGVPFQVVIEPQEYEEYAAVINPKKILVLPFSNLGKGSIPARNWVWEHAITTGAKRHWILDDNIAGFYRLIGGKRIKVNDPIVFKGVEDFTDRYANVALAGMQYKMFAVSAYGSGRLLPPVYANTRIYSCILIKNDIPYRWRGRYNEDTDLSLRVLKDGWCTLLFFAFLCDKVATMKMKGGNTDQLYKGAGRLIMAQELVRQHPDVVTITRKYGRWQHLVDYRKFRRNNRLIKIGNE